MELGEYAESAAVFDQTDDPEKGLQIALFGLAGEAGSVVSEAKKWRREGGGDGLAEKVEEELGDLLWYIAAVANRLGLDLDAVAGRNLEKVRQIWTKELPPPSAYDDGWPANESFPRKMAVRFVEDATGPFPVVRMEPVGELADRVQRERERKQLGASLDDNAMVDDSYRYHDIIHLAHVAVLGWSPVLRSLMGAKRKDRRKDPTGQTDRVEDGARAIATEEGLAAFVFNYVEPDFLEGESRVSWDLLKHVRRTVRDLEVKDQPPVAWASAYLQAFEAFRLLRDGHGGLVEVDLDAQKVSVVGGP